MKLEALTGARFLAALYVLAFHFWPIAHSRTFVGNIINEGHVGVSFFYILSGFVLTYNYCNGQRVVGKRAFLVARFARVYPVYILAMIVSIPLLLQQYQQLYGMALVIRSSLAFVIRAFLLQAWNPSWAIGFNTPSWSLSCEAFFYIVFCFCIPIISRMDLRLSIATLTGFLLLALIPPSIYLAICGDATRWDYGSWLDIVKFSPALRIFEFGVGVGIGRIYLLKQNGGFGRANDAVLISCASLVVTLMATSIRLPYLLLHSGGLCLIFAITIWGLTSSNGLIVKALSTKYIVLLGNASYALYILHFPIRYFYTLVQTKSSMVILNDGLNAAVYTLVSVTISVLVFKLYEGPARKYISKAIKGPDRRSKVEAQVASSIK